MQDETEKPSMGLKEYINLKNSEGRTALHFACMNGSVELVEYLIHSGAVISEVDVEGKEVDHFLIYLIF